MPDTDSIRTALLARQQEMQSESSLADRLGMIALLSLLTWRLWEECTDVSWAWYLLFVVMVGGSIVLHNTRIRQASVLNGDDDDLTDVAKGTLAYIDAEIRLHRNALWYRYIPVGLAVLVHVSTTSLKRLPLPIEEANDSAIALAILSMVALLVLSAFLYTFTVGSRKSVAMLAEYRKEVLLHTDSAGLTSET